VTHFLPLLTIPWRLWVAGLVPPLVLGFPLLLAGWALWRLRGALPAGGLGRAYLLACYSASLQVNAAHVYGERVFPFVHFVVSAQFLNLYVALQALFLSRSLPTAVMFGGIAIATWLAYRYVRPAVIKRLLAWDTVAALETYTPAQRRAWGLLGHACFWGAFTFIFVMLILREYFL